MYMYTKYMYIIYIYIQGGVAAIDRSGALAGTHRGRRRVYPSISLYICVYMYIYIYIYV